MYMPTIKILRTTLAVLITVTVLAAFVGCNDKDSAPRIRLRLLRNSRTRYILLLRIIIH